MIRLKTLIMRFLRHLIKINGLQKINLIFEYQFGDKPLIKKTFPSGLMPTRSLLNQHD